MPWKYIITGVWAVAWACASFGFHSCANKMVAEAGRAGEPQTGLAPGGEVRVEGRLASGPLQTSLIGKAPCVAALADVSYVIWYYDAQHKTQYDSSLIATRRVGPELLDIRVGEELIRAPLARWMPQRQDWLASSRQLEQVPAELGVSPAEIASAKARVRDGTFAHYAVSEWVFPADSAAFVMGRLVAQPAAPHEYLLEPDPALGKLIIFPGTQAQLVESLSSSASGLHLAGWIVLALGLLPISIVGLLGLRAAR